ncbi:hypothetical protein B0J11DRAFT_600758 [Dendryphion nanum]|uniref:Acyltransferase 3 domain-containing protein n=1 Tax=Dendryphion nanum TaxID=256645 RepID=A0A9P9E988_9PLEO|nr:hypothetical protein B0J11DRAFT_600758 [Dendryphion nanum]
MKSPLSSSRLSPFVAPSPDPLSIPSQDYLLGLRGIFVIQSFLFVFFQTLLPTAVVDSKNVSGPLYQVILRKSLSILFWNESLIYSFIIFLSARTLCLPFLSNGSRAVCSSSIFRRGIRLWIPTFIAFSLSAAIFSTASTGYVTDFLNATENISIKSPTRIRNFLIYFNSLFDLFWVTKFYGNQAANEAFPSGTLWVISVIFQQSYTVYMTMAIIPHTRTKWRVRALFIFILTAWWVASWAWYSISGLLLADAVLNMNFKQKSRNGFQMGKSRVPVWPFYVALVVAGLLLQFLFIAWRPELRYKELQGHTALYTPGSLNDGVDLDDKHARDDNFLIILGVMLLVETFDGVQRVLRNRFLVSMGRRSLSVFLVQPLLIYTAGIKLYMFTQASSVNHEAAVLACFVVCVPLVMLVSELFYRIVDIPSMVVAKETWEWLRK